MPLMGEGRGWEGTRHKKLTLQAALVTHHCSAFQRQNGFREVRPPTQSHTALSSAVRMGTELGPSRKPGLLVSTGSALLTLPKREENTIPGGLL